MPLGYFTPAVVVLMENHESAWGSDYEPQAPKSSRGTSSQLPKSGDFA